MIQTGDLSDCGQLWKHESFFQSNISSTFLLPSCTSPCPWPCSLPRVSHAPAVPDTLTVSPCTAHLFPITSSAHEPCLTGSLALLYIVSIFRPSLARFYKLPLCNHSSCCSIPRLYFCPLQLIACWLSNFLSRFLLHCTCHISAHNKQKCLVFQHYSAPHHLPAIPGVKYSLLDG